MAGKHAPHSANALLLLLILVLQAAVAHAQVIDLDSDRLPITSVAQNWRFHPGDDPHWADPAFDDSGWKTIQPSKDWSAQGYSDVDGVSWFRFKLRPPAHANSFVLQLPRLSKNVAVYAGGRLISQVGNFPPEPAKLNISAARVFTIPVDTASPDRTTTIAIRMWRPPALAQVLPNIAIGPSLAGNAATLLSNFNLQKQASLLRLGSEYTQDIVLLLVGGASALLFWFTRESYYLWFVLYALFALGGLPVSLAAPHFAWGFFDRLYLLVALDALQGIMLALFFFGALGLRDRRLIIAAITLPILGEAGLLLVSRDAIPVMWADALYFAAYAVLTVLSLVLLARAAIRGRIDARLLFFAYLPAGVISITSNLGHVLNDLNLPFADKFLLGYTDVLTEPFTVSLADLGSILLNIGILMVLTYRFGRTSREQQRLATAIQAAHDLQHRLIPTDIPDLLGMHTDIAYLAAEEVGGDFCQVLPRADGSVLMVIGDVSGKGLQAAMVGTFAVGAVRSLAEEDIGPAAALHRINQVVLRTAYDGFITCLCVTITRHGLVTMANAGHLAPYLNGKELSLDVGLPLGIVPDAEYAETWIHLQDSARLTLLSDGVVEARSSTGELFGFDRTSRLSHLAAAELAEQARRHGQQDDITILTLDWKAPVAEPAYA